MGLFTSVTGCGSSDPASGEDTAASHPAADAGAADPGRGDPDEPLTELPEIDPSEGFRIDEGTFVVPPGDELYYCVRIPIPAEFAGRDLALIGWEWDLPKNTHHYFMAYSEEPVDFPGDGPVPCDGQDPTVPIAVSDSSEATGTSLGEGKLLFGAGVGVDRYVGTPDYGRVMRAGGHFVTNHHVLNTSSEPVEMHARFNIHVRDLEEVPFPTNQLNCLTMDVDTPPQSEREVTATCTAPFDLDLVLLASHAHNHLTRFETRIFDGEQTLPEVIYESEDWDSPALEWQDEPIHLKKGQGLTFTCYYENIQDTPVGFGLGLENEMCATMNGYAFPEGREYEVPPPLGALITTNEPAACLGVDEAGNVGEVPDCTVVDTSDPTLPITIPFF